MAVSGKAKYPALRIIAAWYKAFGYLVGAVIFLAGMAALFKGGSGSVAIGLMVGAVVFVIMSMSIAEIIQVFLDTEDNTKSSADSLKELLDLQVKGKAQKAPPTQSVKPAAKRQAPPKGANESQAQSIKNLIRNLHSDGMSSAEIAQELRSEGMPVLGGADSWTAGSVDEILSKH